MPKYNKEHRREQAGMMNVKENQPVSSPRDKQPLIVTRGDSLSQKMNTNRRDMTRAYDYQ
jgi:hypothetical protein